ncbi:LysM domain-containing protein [Leifsonia sp. ZF2019]|uniref:LysM peptidoglycan-binding domain-containing protein n=1 Tax=Leifsonia sp. ZF2019 TaxID=2781978 RepID=UPI001CBD29FD|nr:LysM domain-containing protein [Leifsonia sp. ZF2019]UAJ80721.1 LysM domain-containing protein [Leifsonia sp. ZF2019]
MSTGGILRRTVAAIVGAAATLLLLSGCALFAQKPHPTPAHTRTTSPTPAPTGTPVRSGIGSSPAPAPVIAPTLTPVPSGTVVAEGDVASPKGSIHYHYRVVSNGDNTYDTQYSGFTSTVPVPVSVTFLETAPRVGDGLTDHGVGDFQLGGPTTGTAAASSTVIGGKPSYLAALVTYSSAPSFDGVPVELGPNKVLAVNSVHWSVPVRASNVHPVDGGATPGANGTVTATTASGAPRTYLVDSGDAPAGIAARFGIQLTDLYWLNPDLPSGPDQKYVLAGTQLNLDPDSL